jgi:hypothetical protein
MAESAEEAEETELEVSLQETGESATEQEAGGKKRRRRRRRRGRMTSDTTASETAGAPEREPRHRPPVAKEPANEDEFDFGFSEEPVEAAEEGGESAPRAEEAAAEETSTEGAPRGRRRRSRRRRRGEPAARREETPTPSQHEREAEENEEETDLFAGNDFDDSEAEEHEHEYVEEDLFIQDSSLNMQEAEGDEEDEDAVEHAANYTNVPTWEEAISYLLHPSQVQVEPAAQSHGTSHRPPAGETAKTSRHYGRRRS